MVIAATSTEFVRVTVTPVDSVDVTGTAPRIAILPASNRDNPAPGDWKNADWITGTTTARLIVGPEPGLVQLARGSYSVWINFDPPGSENVVARSGRLTVI